jgi:hypothetical protein
MKRRHVCAALAGLALVLGVTAGVAGPAGAEYSPVNPLTSSVDKAVAHPGETVTLTLTFTNPETVPVTFGYLSASPTFGTWYSGMQYGITSCTGQVSSCWLSNPSPPMGAYMNPSTSIAPGDSRTVTITYDVAAGTPCGGGRYIAFYFYTYRESSAGNFDRVVDGPGTTIDC